MCLIGKKQLDAEAEAQNELALTIARHQQSEGLGFSEENPKGSQLFTLKDRHRERKNHLNFRHIDFFAYFLHIVHIFWGQKLIVDKRGAPEAPGGAAPAARGRGVLVRRWEAPEKLRGRCVPK